eukprot:2161406-Rhodomonas_salina.1
MVGLSMVVTKFSSNSSDRNTSLGCCSRLGTAIRAVSTPHLVGQSWASHSRCQGSAYQSVPGISEQMSRTVLPSQYRASRSRYLDCTGHLIADAKASR